MKMAGPDILLFVVGALLLGGATFAIVAQGGPSALGGGSPTGIYDVTYATGTVDVMKQPVSDFSVATKFDAKVAQTNVTKLIIAVACTDPASALPAGGFNLRIEVTPPNGIPAPKPTFGICGQAIKVEVPVAAVPPKTSAQGSDAKAAEQSIPQDANATRAVGSWSISVQGARAGGTAPVGVPVGNPAGSVNVQAETWTAKLAPLTK